MRTASSRPGEHDELMAQEQVLKHQILAWAHHGSHGCEQEPENVKHGVSIADLPPREVLPPHNRCPCCGSTLTIRHTPPNTPSTAGTGAPTPDQQRGRPLGGEEEPAGGEDGTGRDRASPLPPHPQTP